LRTLIRNARKEQAENKPPKAYREIFQILKQLQIDEKKAAAGQANEEENDDDNDGIEGQDDYHESNESQY